MLDVPIELVRYLAGLLRAERHRRGTRKNTRLATCWKHCLCHPASFPARGCQVRIAVGDPDSANVAARGAEEKFGHGVESRCRLAVMHYTPLASVQGCQVQTHATTLYNSVYRVDDQMLINAHLWGMNAYGAPLWHLRRVPETQPSMFDTYLASFDEVWATATTVQER